MIENYSYHLEKALIEIEHEVYSAKKTFTNDFVNQHEAYAVILEEFDELWTEIKKKQTDYVLGTQRKEAVQTAAMLCRLIVELL